MNRNTLIITIILVMIGIILALILAAPSLTSFTIYSGETINLKASTKAICNSSNFCQDYFIECKNSEVKKLSPITGASIQFDKNWQDPRTLNQKEFC